MPKVVPQYKEEAKERIIQAALQVYAEKGPYEATMDDVANELGVSKGALYLYFQSKDELLNEIIKRPEQDIRRFLQSLLENKNLNKSLDKVLNREKDEQKKRRTLLFDFLAEASRNADTRKVLSETYEQNLSALADFLAGRKTNTKQGRGERRYKAISLMSLYIGVIASSILGVDNDELKRAWQRSTKAIVAERING